MNLHWDDLRYFLAIARARSLTGAACTLAVSQPTVSRRLAAMEHTLGVKLFERTRTGYSLSAAGSEILAQAEQVEDEIAQIERRVRGRDQRLAGTLKITCTQTMASLYLAEQLAQFVSMHPDISVSLSCTFTQVSLNRSDAHVAIRTTYEPPDDLVGRKVANAAFAVYCAAEDAHRLRRQTQPSHWSWIGWQDETYNHMLITKRFPHARIKHRVDDMQVMQSMAQHRLGVVILPCHMADPDPRLRRLLTEPMRDDTPDLWILFHPDSRRVARVKSVVDFLAEKITADRALFEGRSRKQR